MSCKHGHIDCCKHENIRYCPKCSKPYCEDCGKEWFEECTRSHYPYIWNPNTTWVTPYTDPTIVYSYSACGHA